MEVDSRPAGWAWAACKAPAVPVVSSDGNVTPVNVESRHRQLIREARSRGIPVTITLVEYVRKLSTGACGYCGGPLLASGSALDRRDPSQGYSEANTTPCCFPCNTGKSELTAEQWMRVIGPAIEKYGTGNVWPRDVTTGGRRERDDAKGAWAVARMVYALGNWAGAPRVRRKHKFKGRTRKSSIAIEVEALPLPVPKVELVRGILEGLALLARG